MMNTVLYRFPNSLFVLVTYRKIHQPVATRWNSLYACLESIVAMKDALLGIKVTEDGTDLAKTIPDESGFRKLKQIMKPLDEIRRASEMLSSENTPTIHFVLCYMMNLNNLQNKYGSLGYRIKEKTSIS